MKTIYRSGLIFAALATLVLPAFWAGGFCQTNALDRLCIGIYPAIFATSQFQGGANRHLPPDSAMARLPAQISSLLCAALRQEHLTFLPPDSFAHFLHSRPAFDPFHPDSVRKFCAAFTVHKLILPVVSPALEAGTPPRMRLMLRWLDGASGEVTKLRMSEHPVAQKNGAVTLVAESFDATMLIQNLINAPELIIAQEESVAPLPVALALPPPVVNSNNSRKWIWYLSAAALGGGSAYWLWGRGGEADKPGLLPEPPGPPP